MAAGNSGAPLPVGTSAEMGKYTVTVTAVDADVAVTVDLAAAGAPEPANGRYVLVELSATYNGANTGSAHMDLLTGLAAWEGPEFYSGDCAAQLPEPSTAVPALAPGESASWQTCLDVLPEALGGDAVRRRCRSR